MGRYAEVEALLGEAEEHQEEEALTEEGVEADAVLLEVDLVFQQEDGEEAQGQPGVEEGDNKVTTRKNM